MTFSLLWPWPLLSQDKDKVMEDTQEWHEDPIPGMGVQQEESDTDSDSDSDSEYAKPGQLLLW